jgi:hypothetical protein
MFQIWLANAPGINNYAPGMPIFLVWLGTTKQVAPYSSDEKKPDTIRRDHYQCLCFFSEVNYIVTYTILYHIISIIYNSLNLFHYILMII